MESSFSVDDALADVQASRVRLAQRAHSPVWYNPILGALFGFLAFSFSWPWVMPWSVVRGVMGGVIGLLSGAMTQIYRRRTGLWFSIERVGARARKIWLGFFVWECLCAGLAALGRLTAYPLLVGGAVGVLAFLTTILVGKKLDEQLRADILAGNADGIMAK